MDDRPPGEPLIRSHNVEQYNRVMAECQRIATDALEWLYPYQVRAIWETLPSGPHRTRAARQLLAQKHRKEYRRIYVDIRREIAPYEDPGMERDFDELWIEAKRLMNLDPQRSYVSIGKELGVSPGWIRKRVKKEQKGKSE